jgi:hypothetical protein
MFQQTTRLYDALASRGLWVDDYALPMLEKLREHEFVTPLVSTNFPADFRLETFQNYCSTGWDRLHLYLTPAEGRVRVGRQPIDGCSWNAEASVLWLTPRLFISKYSISAGAP